MVVKIKSGLGLEKESFVAFSAEFSRTTVTVVNEE